MLFLVLVVCFVHLLSVIPLYKYTIMCLFILSLMDIRVLSSLGLLWIRLLWTFLYKSLCGHMFFLLGKCLRMELLGHRTETYLTLLEIWHMYLKYSIYKEKTNMYWLHNNKVVSEFRFYKGGFSSTCAVHLRLLVHHHSLIESCRTTCCSMNMWLSLFPMSLLTMYFLWMAALLFPFIYHISP